MATMIEEIEANEARALRRLALGLANNSKDALEYETFLKDKDDLELGEDALSYAKIYISGLTGLNRSDTPRILKEATKNYKYLAGDL